MLLHWTLLVLLISYEAVCNAEPADAKVEPKAAEIAGDCSAYNTLPGTCTNPKDCFTLSGLTKNTSSEVQQALSAPKCGSKICCVQCGKIISQKPRTKRVAGGTPVNKGTWPWIVGLGYLSKGHNETNFNCAGSIIADQWVLTGATCVSISSYELKLVRVGIENLEDEETPKEPTGIDVPVEKSIPHPNYTRKGLVKNDIALIRLKSPVKFNNRVLPVCLPTKAEYKKPNYYYTKKVSVAGWGASEFGGHKPIHLQEATITVVPQEECNKNYTRYNVTIDEKLLCAGGNGKDACQGDSGGPLIFQDGGINYLAGIVSFGIGCARPEFPGVYTNVAHYIDWINKEISAYS